MIHSYNVTSNFILYFKYHLQKFSYTSSMIHQYSSRLHYNFSFNKPFKFQSTVNITYIIKKTHKKFKYKSPFMYTVFHSLHQASFQWYNNTCNKYQWLDLLPLTAVVQRLSSLMQALMRSSSAVWHATMESVSSTCISTTSIYIGTCYTWVFTL